MYNFKSDQTVIQLAVLPRQEPSCSSFCYWNSYLHDYLPDTRCHWKRAPLGTRKPFYQACSRVCLLKQLTVQPGDSVTLLEACLTLGLVRAECRRLVIHYLIRTSSFSPINIYLVII